MNRVNIRAILNNPELRKIMMTQSIITIQAREGIVTTQQQAEQAYEKVRTSMKTFKVSFIFSPPERIKCPVETVRIVAEIYPRIPGNHLNPPEPAHVEDMKVFDDETGKDITEMIYVDHIEAWVYFVEECMFRESE